MRPVRIAPSILSADFSCLGDEVQALSKANADYIHIDVMDGHFVPNLTIGPAVVKSLKRHTDKIFDVHLMIAPVDPYIAGFVEAGAGIISFHPEAGAHPHRTIQLIKSYGVKAGLALNPGTPAHVVEPFLNDLDLILVMSVNPGFGGQSYIPMEDKISTLRQMIDASGRDIDLEVDGGMNAETAASVIQAGADVIVAGSYVFKDGVSSYAENIENLRS